MRRFLAAAAIALLATPAVAQVTPIDPSVAKRIDRILKRTPLIDGHNDLPGELREKYGSRVDNLASGSDKLPQPLMTDMARLHAGRVGGQFWSVYIPAASCCAQLLYMKKTLRDSGVNFDKVPLLCDNQSAIQIAHNPVQHNKTKHIEIRHHFIRDHVARGEINLSYVGTEDQLADIFMKPLDKARFRELRHELNIIDSSNVA